MRIYPPLLCLLLVVGCSRTNERSSESVEEAARRIAQVDWDRSRQCAEQAERLFKWWETDGKGTPIEYVDWQNHYNREDRRCYVVLEEVNRNIRAGSGHPQNASRVFDAFDRRKIADYTFENIQTDQWLHCRIDGEKGSPDSNLCERVRRRVEDGLLAK